MNPIINRLDWADLIADYYDPSHNFRSLEFKYKCSVRTIQQVVRYAMEDQFRNPESVVRTNLKQFCEEVRDTQSQKCKSMNERINTFATKDNH